MAKSSTKRSRPANSKGSPKRLNPQHKTNTSGTKIRTGRMYGPGGRTTRSHD